MNKKTFLQILASLPLFCMGCATSEYQKEMSVEKVGKPILLDDSSPTFSGKVKVVMLFSEHAPSELTAADVTFSPKARSAWHIHPKGQMLVVTEGEGVVQEWGKPAQRIKVGDVVWTPPGVKHWHGACLDKELTHTALQEKKNGKNVIWMEKVSDQQYHRSLKEK